MILYSFFNELLSKIYQESDVLNFLVIMFIIFIVSVITAITMYSIIWLFISSNIFKGKIIKNIRYCNRTVWDICVLKNRTENYCVIERYINKLIRWKRLSAFWRVFYLYTFVFSMLVGLLVMYNICNTDSKVSETLNVSNDKLEESIDIYSEVILDDEGVAEIENADDKSVKSELVDLLEEAENKVETDNNESDDNENVEEEIKEIKGRNMIGIAFLILSTLYTNIASKLEPLKNHDKYKRAAIKLEEAIYDYFESKNLEKLKEEYHKISSDILV